MPLLPALAVAAAIAVGANWPSFRGEHGRGVADGTPPITWDAPSGAGIRWHVDIPGISHASPIVWNGRVYLITAVAEGSTLDLSAATAGSVIFATDTVEHEWRLYCLDASSGAVEWSRTVHTATPRQARHARGTYANATPATNGAVIVASLGNEGLFAFDMDGTLRWRVAMTPPRHDASLDPASSPIIAGNLAIVQNDWREGAFAAAYDLDNGREVWRVARNEGLAWSTPAFWKPASDQPQIVFNSARWIRGHDVATGTELWRLDNSVESPWDRVPTPVPAGDRLLIGGGGPQGALMSLTAGARGDISGDSPHMAWRVDRGSPYLPTPLVYDGLVYAVTDSGVLSVYREGDGTLVYRARIASDTGTISASPIAAGGHLYFASTDGDIFVVRAGNTFALAARNPMGSAMFASPAVWQNLLIIRTASGIYAVGA